METSSCRVIGYGYVGSPAIAQLNNSDPDNNTPKTSIKNALYVDDTCIREYVDPLKLRRVDHFTKLGLIAAFRAIENCKMVSEPDVDCGHILVTGFGPVLSTCQFKDSYLTHGALGASPTLFSKSVQNQAVATIATMTNTGSCVSTLCQQSLPVFYGLLVAVSWLNENRCNYIMVTMVDELAPILDYYYDLNGFNVNSWPGEGAASLILAKTGNGIGLSLDVNSSEKILFKRPNEKITCSTFYSVDGTKNRSNDLPDFGYFPVRQGLDVACMCEQIKNGEKGICCEGYNGMSGCITISKEDYENLPD